MAANLSADELSKLFHEVVRLELDKFAEEGLQKKLANFVDMLLGSPVKYMGPEIADTVVHFNTGTLSEASSEDHQAINVAHERSHMSQKTRKSDVGRSNNRLDWSKRHFRSFTMKVENEETHEYDAGLKRKKKQRKQLVPGGIDDFDSPCDNANGGDMPVVPNTPGSGGSGKPRMSKLEEVTFESSSSKLAFGGDTAEDALRIRMTEDSRTRSGFGEEQSLTYKCAARVVTHPWFERIVSAVILSNAIHIGFTTDYMARDGLSEQPLQLEVAECLFLTLFLSELLIRFYVFRFDIYRKRLSDGRANLGFHQNVIDTVVIGLQLIEKIFYYGRLHQISLLSQMSVLRLLRLLKILRLVRVLRTLRSVQDLRMIIHSVARSFSLFCWSLVALWFLTFLWSVYLTDLVRDDRVKREIGDLQSSITPQNEAVQVQQEEFFGNLPRTMITLLWTITGGEDWRHVFEALAATEHAVLAWLPLLIYIFFASLAMMNVITGVFLETAVERAKQEKEIFLVRNARMIFACADADKSGMISWPDFENALTSSDVQNFFESIDIDLGEAKSLFELLDMSGDGKISADEFLNGCLRVRGPAKNLDLLVVSREVDQLFERLLTSTNELQMTIAKNFAGIEANRRLLIDTVIARGKASAGPSCNSLPFVQGSTCTPMSVTDSTTDR